MTYSEDLTNVANPERGFYVHTESHSTNYNLLNSETLIGLKHDRSITQILRVFYLEDFRTKPISPEYLNNIRKDFATVRDAGIKIIVRFAYSQGTTSPYDDATPEVVLNHIGQLAPIFQENGDIIITVQAGFIGTWGEWFYTDHFAQMPGNLSEEDWLNRKKVTLALLEALPANRTIQLRTPRYKTSMFQTHEPLNEQLAFSTNDLARIGHHNDCFVASSNDLGTYLDQDKEKAYLESETKYVPMGGETCGLAPPYSDCENSTLELERFHWSYLNAGYNLDVLDEWRNQGCMDEITLRLGYRHRLISSTVNTEAKPNGEFVASLSLINSGYANFFNKRNLYVILKNNETLKEYQLKAETDPRKWPIGAPHNITISGGIPQAIPEGLYSVYLSLPDENLLLQENPDYAVRLTNTNTWDASLGYNDLGVDVSISVQNDHLPNYESTQYFREADADSNLELPGSSLIKGSGNSNSIAIYWPLQEDSLHRLLERSVNNEPFYSHVALNGQTGYYIDSDVTAENKYAYRYKIIDNSHRATQYSNIIQTSPDQSEFIIDIDGNGDDWVGTAPLLGSFGNGFETLKTFFGHNSAFFLIENTTQSTVYLNVDNRAETGMVVSGHEGMDYKIEDSKLFEANNAIWTFVSNVETIADKALEIRIPFDKIPLLGQSPSIGILCTSNGSFLKSGHSEAATYHRQVPADIPTILSVENDELNENAFVISWETCSYCDGYILERSENTEDNFILVDTLSKDVHSVRNRGLNIGSTYYYRLKTFNNLGPSEYSETKVKTLEIVLSIQKTDLVISPNPSSSHIEFSESVAKVVVRSLDGQVVLEQEEVRKLFIGNLRNGVYLLQITDNYEVLTHRIIKN